MSVLLSHSSRSSVASIRDKATSAKNATVTKIQDTRDRHSSTPMARTRFVDAGYVPDARKAPPPPPPPMRAHSSTLRANRASVDVEEREDVHSSAPPPPVVRSTKPGLGANASMNPSHPPPPPPPGRVSSVFERAKAFGAETTPAAPTPSPRWSQRASKQDMLANVDTIDWVNLSSEDKRVFFEWLDEFFARYLGRACGVSAKEEAGMKVAERFSVHVEPPRAPPVSSATVVAGAKNGPASRRPPPTIRSWSKPSIDTVSDFTPSYPPTTAHGSQALDLAYYFHPSTHWDSTWYTEPGGIPPPLQSNPHRLYKAQMMSRGDARSIQLAVLFCDLSAAWVSVSFSASTNRITERTAQYLPVPASLPQDLLLQANETYGEAVASFAESFLGSGQFCARGECWDLASEALKFFASDPAIPPPAPSLGRTHGHLIFAGRATPGGRQAGKWRGGDDRVRRGDIVEWRSVRRIGVVGGPPGRYAILGDPEHTAIITRDAIPSPGIQVYDGASMEPRALRELEVVEQSRNDPPEPVKRCYDLERFEEGEVWIYRPISMDVYLGFGEFECTVPPMALSV